MQRSDKDSLFESIAHSQFLDARHEFCDEFVEYVIEDVKTLDGETRLTAIEEASDGGGTGCLVNVRIVTNNHRIAAAELQRHPLDRLRGDFHHMLSGRGSSGETDLSHPRILENRLADNFGRT